jgi:excinuclease UvrABC nuclease subunit
MTTEIIWHAPDLRTLSFGVYQHDGQWNDLSGLYMFCRQELNGSYTPLYIGQAVSLKDRLPLHEQWNPAVRKGAQVVLAKVVAHQSDRDYFERCLIQQFQPELNVHHKDSIGLGMLSSFHFPSG